jgi:proline iminopeptidase
MVPDQTAVAGDGLYPPLEPFCKAHLDVDGGHRIYFEESGNPNGFPVLFVHGGPGSQTRAAHRRFFDPDFYRIILFDQRGCGQSTPAGSLVVNTTAHLVADMEALRRHLGLNTWLLFGGSWGSTLILAYALVHRDAVAGMILRGVFLGSQAEVDWFLRGVRQFVPDAWADFSRDIGDDIFEYYRTALDDPRAEEVARAARRWSDYETRLMEPAKAAAPASATPGGEGVGGLRIQMHYMANHFFLRPGELLDNLWRLRGLPVTIVQGRLDMVCPPTTAYDVSQRIDGAQLRMVANGGHSALQREIATELCAATREMKTRLGG